jgi:hypothetical protein
MPETPTFQKPPPALVQRFEEVLGRLATPATTRRPMFGHPCAWVGGNMATGLFADQWWVRLPPERLDAVLASGEARTLEVMPGREMRGYAVMPDDVVQDDAAVSSWVAEALAFSATLPEKVPKPRRPGKPRSPRA